MNQIQWPEEKPPFEEFHHGWLLPGTEAILRKYLRPDMKAIVELGVWMGKSTRFFLEQCPEAVVYAVDTWDRDHLMQWARARHPHLVEVAGRPLSQFLVNLWDHRDRIIPVQMDSIKGIRALQASGVKPDLVYLDTTHQHPHTYHEIQAIKAAYPEVQLTGDDWEYKDRRGKLAVQQSVRQFVSENKQWKIDSEGNGWALT